MLVHRDVRVAVASALRTMPEDPRVFGALREAAGWSEEWRDLLRQLRGSAHREVSRMAWEVTGTMGRSG